MWLYWARSTIVSFPDLQHFGGGSGNETRRTKYYCTRGGTNKRHCLLLLCQQRSLSMGMFSRDTNKIHPPIYREANILHTKHQMLGWLNNAQNVTFLFNSGPISIMSWSHEKRYQALPAYTFVCMYKPQLEATYYTYVSSYWDKYHTHQAWKT